VHGDDGLGNADLPPSDRPLGPDRGPAAIVRLAHGRPGELTLVCLGPLTNLAIALNVEPRLPGLLRGVVVMGGAYREPGNSTPHAEFNVWCDPEAAAQVFAAPIPRLTAIGLDVTHRTALPRRSWEALRGASEPAPRLVWEVGRRTFTERGMDGFYLHDPLAVGVALDPSLVSTEAWTVSVVTEGEADGATRLAGAGSTLVAMGVDAERFLREFCRVLGLPAVG
jgi:inosine-uridine nucleoside N-ribohydrolase